MTDPRIALADRLESQIDDVNSFHEEIGRYSEIGCQNLGELVAQNGAAIVSALRAIQPGELERKNDEDRNRHKESTCPESDSATETSTDKLLEALEANCWDLRCIDLPTGAGDADIGWNIVEHHMAHPKERIIGCGSSPIEALNDAMEKT